MIFPPDTVHVTASFTQGKRFSERIHRFFPAGKTRPTLAKSEQVGRFSQGGKRSQRGPKQGDVAAKVAFTLRMGYP